jgi:signal peptidase II
MLRRIWLIAITAIVVIALDALAKMWAVGALQMGESQPFLPGLLQFTLTKNSGVAFGVGRGLPSFVPALISIAVVGVLVAIMIRRESRNDHLSRLEQVAFGMIIGGALGNIGDRLLHGMVTDFLEFTFIQFPVFNVADALIDVGIGLLIIASIFAPNAASGGKQAASE